MINILLTVIATGVLGGALSLAWQRRQWLFQQKFQRLADTHDRQIVATLDLFNLVHRRLGATRFYVDSLYSGTMQQIASERTRYRNTVGQWNEDVHSIIIRLRVLYKYQTAIDLEQTFQTTFTDLDKRLRQVRLAREKHHAPPFPRMSS